MKERPILFSGPMVRAILAGTKTQTRRIVKPQPFTAPLKEGECYVTEHEWRSNILRYGKLPYGKPGDRLWVKETFAPYEDTFIYRADWEVECPRVPLTGCWKPSIFCSQKASRITLEIIAVRVERLHDISEKDAQSEGVARHLGQCATKLFSDLWTSINGLDSWTANPWVWVIEFKRVTDSGASRATGARADGEMAEEGRKVGV